MIMIKVKLLAKDHSLLLLLKMICHRFDLRIIFCTISNKIIFANICKFKIKRERRKKNLVKVEKKKLIREGKFLNKMK